MSPRTRGHDDNAAETSSSSWRRSSSPDTARKSDDRLARRPLQEYLAGRLSAWELNRPLRAPDAETGRQAAHPAGLDFEGPLMLGSAPCRRQEPPSERPHRRRLPPSQGTVDERPESSRGARRQLYGRGSNDMKGGIAAMVVAAEALAGRGSTRGLIVATNTDEESSGAGAMAWSPTASGPTRASSRSRRASTSGSPAAARATQEIEIPGRPGHAENAQPHWRKGGAVNAIEKAVLVLDEIGRLRERLEDPRRPAASLSLPQRHGPDGHRRGRARHPSRVLPLHVWGSLRAGAGRRGEVGGRRRGGGRRAALRGTPRPTTGSPSTHRQSRGRPA